MKRKNIPILITVLAISILLVFSLSSCVTVRLNTIKGSGDITKQEVDISGAEKLIFSGLGEVIIEQGEENSLLIEADDNLIEYIRAEVSGDRLTIGFKKGVVSVIPTETPKFYLTIEKIENLKLTGAGSISGEGIDADELVIESSGLGIIEIEEIDAEELMIEISGAGNVVMSGQAQEQKIKISGLGSYKAEDLISKDAEVEISGAGKATVYATETLDVNLTGLGSVEYLGDPSVTQKITGPGSVRSVD